MNAARISESLARNPMLLTALAPRIGYDRAAAIAKRAAAESRPILDIAVEETGLPRDELARLLDPGRLARGGRLRLVNAAAPLEPHRLPTAQLRVLLRERLARRPDARDPPRIGHYTGGDAHRLRSLTARGHRRARRC